MSFSFACLRYVYKCEYFFAGTTLSLSLARAKTVFLSLNFLLWVLKVRLVFDVLERVFHHVVFKLAEIFRTVVVVVVVVAFAVVVLVIAGAIVAVDVVMTFVFVAFVVFLFGTAASVVGSVSSCITISSTGTLSGGGGAFRHRRVVAGFPSVFVFRVVILVRGIV